MRSKQGFALTKFSQALRDKSDSVAPAGLGYIAIILWTGVLRKKKARFIGRANSAQTASLNTNPFKRIDSRGINFQRPMTFSKRRAQGLQAQTILRVSTS